ncbi:DUF502 domain-containing protein [Candidatus Hepatincola sp. Pdp]
MAEKKQERAIISKLRTWFLTGLLVSLPIILTFYIVIAILHFFDTLVLQNLFPTSFLNKIPGLGIVLTALAMVLIGFVAQNFLGQFVINLSNKILNRIPFIRSLYSTIKQVLDTVLSNKSNAFKEVVLIEYPRRGMWSLGFVTSKNKGEVQHKTKDDILNVFLPTTPNPTSGFLLFVPKKDAIRLAMPPEVAMKLIVSGGVIDSFNYEALEDEVTILPDDTDDTVLEELKNIDQHLQNIDKAILQKRRAKTTTTTIKENKELISKPNKKEKEL